ncbi:CmcJ/NvfI family oxidoreductase [Gayadomonas joobiniege]|uniref:CmcJ/NvfI family oxidoreductase n=1 Tax=Gayadomonas joobiniege TaxID=1234606 RepID=UPI00037E13CD|nr:CmcJ/NvfI family oxidoreductase [Gayadomonas joobiniege]
MKARATVNYHVKSHLPQFFQIDAGGIKGQLISPKLLARQVDVADERDRPGLVNFLNDGLVFTEYDFDNVDFINNDFNSELYQAELTDLVKKHLPARQVIAYDHTIRNSADTEARKPVKNVHSDFSEAGAKQRLFDILGPERAKIWLSGHFAFINVWRPLAHPVSEWPLGFVQPNTVSADDWETIVLKYPDRIGEILGLTYSVQHQWLYRSNMTPNEAALFNVFDNKGLQTVAHSALELHQMPTRQPRKSIESRLLVQY